MPEVKEGTIYGAENAPVVKFGGNDEIQDGKVTEVQDPKTAMKSDGVTDK